MSHIVALIQLLFTVLTDMLVDIIISMPYATYKQP